MNSATRYPESRGQLDHCPGRCAEVRDVGTSQTARIVDPAAGASFVYSLQDSDIALCLHPIIIQSEVPVRTSRTKAALALFLLLCLCCSMYSKYVPSLQHEPIAQLLAKEQNGLIHFILPLA